MRPLLQTVILAGLVALLASGCQHEAPTGAAEGPGPEWMTDFPAAVAKAKAEGKPLLLDFTGSDWCPACMELHRRVLSQKAFADYAGQNLILVLVDFPERKPLPKAQEEANESLSKAFEVEGFPTLIVLDSDGKKILGKMVGYDGSTPKQFVAKIEKMKKG
jgi:protein disulfide-isomerase